MERFAVSTEPSKIFVLLDYYLPGYKSGGSLRSLCNLVERMGDNFEFWIFTRDRDLGDPEPYPGVVIDAWNRLGKARVFYSSPRFLNPWSLRRLIQQAGPNVVYLNSFFSPRSVLYLILRRLYLLPDLPVILAPRGEFSPGALRFGAVKKRAYILMTRCLGLLQGTLVQASSQQEAEEIRAVFGGEVNLKVAPDLSPMVPGSHQTRAARPTKKAGEARFVFVSRISPKKNLSLALSLLSKVRGEILFDIYGPQEDAAYWSACQELIRKAPASVRINYMGPVPNERVREILSQYHFFLFPTLGENFGHVIIEAATAGCAILISDKTPWRDLRARGVGWNLPLHRMDSWQAALQECVDMNELELRQFATRAVKFALDWVTNPEILSQNIELFTSAGSLLTTPPRS